MTAATEILAIIPAKGMSRGIPRKNLAVLAGKPLLYWTILAARQSKRITRIIVSSEDKEILEFARGQEVEAFQRPLHLSSDDASSESVVLHVLEVLREREGEVPGTLVLLQPTSPLRDHEDIDRALDLFFKENCTAVISGYAPPKNPLKHFLLDKDGYLAPLRNEEDPFLPRQLLPDTFMPNGAIYIIETWAFSNHGRFFTKQTLPFYMGEDKSIDIDEPADLERAAAILDKMNMKK